MSLPIITADQRLAERRGVKGVLVGKSGIGKTSQLWTLKPSATLFFDLEAGDLAVEGWTGDTVRPRTWQECRDFAVFIGGPNPALRDDQPYSQAHFDAVCQRFGESSSMDKYDTVGIDAIMNMKGYNHHFGLERYPMVEAHNLGSQVPNEKLLEYAKQVKADAILVSQIVTQKDVHIKNLTEIIELAEAEKLRDKFIIVVGGPRVNNKTARELGYDAGFGSGTYAEHVATFIVKKLHERITKH